MSKRKWIIGLIAIVLLIITLYTKQSAVSGEQEKNRESRIEERGDRREAGDERKEAGGDRIEDKGGKTDPATIEERGSLNRNASSLIYSKHARCRMDCRHISESEVVEVLKKGHINYSKSDMRGQPDPKYAIEGVTIDGQEVRIIFANSPRGIVVVTVIDLENEWKCNCK
jgi:Domain of unknown function (DUF4258)